MPTKPARREARRLGRDVPVDIKTVRPATEAEIELWNWHHEMVAREASL